MGSLRIALCQVDSVVGDLDGNAQRVLAALDVASSEQADIAAFPELVLSGYPPEDLLLKPSFIAANRRALQDVAAATASCVAVVGFIDAVGDDLYNAAAVCADGAIQGVWRKELLPNYGVFDEQRWFTPGTGDTPLFLVAGVKVGVTVCEDAWSFDGPVARLVAGGAEVVVSLNASPYRSDVLELRRSVLRDRVVECGRPIAYVNLVGGQDELVFDGGSMLVGSDGSVLSSAPQFEEATLVVDLEIPERLIGSSDALPVKLISGFPVAKARRAAGVVAPALSRVQEVYKALVLATRDYVDKNGFSDVVVSLSGGIDSALVAMVAVDAIGPERVHTVALPSRFSSQGSLDDAAALVSNLKIDHRVIPIESVHEGFLELLAPSFLGRAPDLAEENLQARIRGTVLMGLSNKFGWLVLTTGNKSEMAVGYATLYGDMAGGFAVIKDVPKTLVYELCELRNREAGYDVIPRAIIDKPPSAELRPDQVDEDSLPPYSILDPILEGYVEQDLSLADLVDAGFEEATVRRVIGLVDRAEYKRRQSPPGVKVTMRAFGKDRRMPITNGFSSLALVIADPTNPETAVEQG
ncbi:MAG TPA: NAD+ synthase [Acidimicrobiales bacterium]